MFETYKQLDKSILNLIATNFCLQLINSVFFLILNIFMAKEGYSDAEIANFISYRFASVVLFAFPFGLFIKGKRLKPFILTTALCLPLVSFFIVYAVSMHFDPLIKLLSFCWGVFFSTTFIITLPYILRNADASNHTPAISLGAASWSLGLIVGGSVIYLLTALSPTTFTNEFLLKGFSLLGFSSLFFALRLPNNENVVKKNKENKKDFYKYDWSIIFIVVLPTLAIAIGAGLTIPFMNLFFYNVFGMDADRFSLLGSTTAIFVAAGALLVPKIKDRFGYEAITVTQTLSICMLILLGTSEFFQDYSFAFYMAIICFIFRQPLMNLANPLTSEMSMYYVGKRNQEIVSAVNSSIWSGSWFFSSKIFGYLRSLDLAYAYIFYITAAMYLVGVLLYYLLIVDFRKKERLGLIN